MMIIHAFDTCSRIKRFRWSIVSSPMRSTVWERNLTVAEGVGGGGVSGGFGGGEPFDQALGLEGAESSVGVVLAGDEPVGELLRFQDLLGGELPGRRCGVGAWGGWPRLDERRVRLAGER